MNPENIMKSFVIVLAILTASGVLLGDEAEPLAPTYRDLPYGPDPCMSWTSGKQQVLARVRCWFTSTVVAGSAATRNGL